jgi:hypothetical protein
MDQAIIFFLAAVFLVGALILALICSSKKGGKSLNVEYYRAKCLEIEHQLKRDEFSSYHLSVLNADKLVDKAMTDRGFGGNNMGDRLKSAAKVFTDRNGIWNAHKLRNRIAHEADVSVTYDQARTALASFRQALKDLGAI